MSYRNAPWADYASSAGWWSPQEVGETLAGIYLGFDEEDGTFGMQGFIALWTGENEVRLNLNSSLAKALEKLNPVMGETYLKIRFTAWKKFGGGKRMREFSAEARVATPEEKAKLPPF